MQLDARALNIRSMVEPDRVHRLCYTDPDIFQREMDLISLQGVEGVGLGRDEGGDAIVVFVSSESPALRSRIRDILSGVRYIIQQRGEIRAAAGD